MKNLFINTINFYQIFLSFDRGILRVFAPGAACRYDVTCSEYAKKAILEYGILRGSLLGIKRLLSCR